MPYQYPFPVWGTQDGGLAKREQDHFVFVQKPNCSGFETGDRVPDEWELFPANDSAQLFDDFGPSLSDEVFEHLCDVEEPFVGFDNDDT